MKVVVLQKQAHLILENVSDDHPWETLCGAYGYEPLVDELHRNKPVSCPECAAKIAEVFRYRELLERL